MTSSWSRWGLKRPGSRDASASTSASFRASSSLLKEDVEAQDGDHARVVDRNLSNQGQRREIVRGIISVTVERAENLVSQDVLAMSDPYVVLKTRKNRNKKQSKVVYKCLNPEWNQTFDFLVEDGINEMLDIKVWDHDTFGRDFLGSCTTSLTTAIRNGEEKAEFTLNGVASGVIFITLKWNPVPFEKVNHRRFNIHQIS